MRKAGLALFVLILAADSCPQLSCDTCSTVQTSYPVGTLDPGASDGGIDYGCQTCGHTTVEATWTSLSGASGFVQVSLFATCGSVRQGDTLTSTAAPSAGSVSISNVPAPDACAGGTVDWTADATNFASQTITGVTVRVTCPKPSGGTAVAPTSIRVR